MSQYCGSVSETFAAASAAELAVVERNGFVESRHIGSAVVLDPEGNPVRSLGDAAAPILPRSSLKPMQALAVLATGAMLEGERLAIATASHSGSDRHVGIVRDILDSARLNERALQCPPARYRGSDPERIRMECSGKHAAMLLACVTAGWDTAGYLAPDHPLQVQIRELVERFIGTRVTATAVDGCGAPMFAMSLDGLAKAIHRIGTSSESSPFALHRNAGALVRAVREHPWAIAGEGRPDTVLIERLGIFAKTGAEGVLVMVAPNGTTVAVKILDGSARAGAVVAVQLLEQEGALRSADVAATLAELPLSVRGGDAIVGAIRPAF